MVTDLAALLEQFGVAAVADPVLAVRRDVPDGPPAADPEGGTAGVGRSAPAVPLSAGDGRDPERRTLHGAPGERVFASPLARRLAHEAGLAVAEIDGTGPRARILRRDVERVIAARSSSATSGAPAASPVARPTPAAAASYVDVPHSRMRRATAERLTESKQTAPHFYLRATVRADRLLRLRSELNDGATVPVSLNDLLVKAAAAAHVRVPEMNVIWTDDAVRTFSTVDISVAVATERGLLTPVLRDVPSLTVTALAARVRDLVDRARAGRLRQDELEGGSISVTNLGMFGTEEFAAIINPPQAAILAVGAAREEAVVEDGALEVGQVLRVTLSVDHRPVDGVVAARWMADFVDLLEHPVRILA